MRILSPIVISCMIVGCWWMAGSRALAAGESSTFDLLAEYYREGGCDSQDTRYTITAPAGVPVDAGDPIHIEGTEDISPQTQVIVVSACFYDGLEFLGEVQQLDHSVVVDIDNYLRGDINALDFGGCYPCLFADSMKVMIATSIGGIPPLYMWSSDNYLTVGYSGVIPTVTPTIPSSGGSGMIVMIVIISGLLVGTSLRRD